MTPMSRTTVQCMTPGELAEAWRAICEDLTVYADADREDYPAGRVTEAEREAGLLRREMSRRGVTA